MGCALSRQAPDYAGLSLWHGTSGEDWSPRTRLPGDRRVDVVVVGAGFTGLWTAYYLARADPSLSVMVLEAETAGFGASGRNGGWCSALFPASSEALARLPGADRPAAQAQHQAMRASVDEVLRVAAEEGIDAQAHKGGSIVLARSRAQLAAAWAEVSHARTWGRAEDDLRLLGAGEAREHLDAAGTVGGTFTPDCAALNPTRLVRGLARVVESLGVTLHEGTRVTALTSGEVRTAYGTVRADVVVRATEGYTPALPGLRRALAPVYSLMVATEPLSAAMWDQIGLRDRQTFSDHRNLIVYGQRTADGRLAFGGRGAPYHFGSAISGGFDRDAHVHASLRQTLLEMLPVLSSVRFTHAWGGVLGIPRDWCASVGLDRSSGMAAAGGYVGDGVGTSNLAGRTLRDLILGHDTALTRLPWVDHHSPSWEPEPWRWLGVNAGLTTMATADLEQRLTRRRSVLVRAMAPLTGGH